MTVAMKYNFYFTHIDSYLRLFFSESEAVKSHKANESAVQGHMLAVRCQQSVVNCKVLAVSCQHFFVSCHSIPVNWPGPCGQNCKANRCGVSVSPGVN